MSDERATISVGDLMWLYDLPDDPSELSIDEVVDLKAMRDRIDASENPEIERLISGIYKPAIDNLLDARLAAARTHERLAAARGDIGPSADSFASGPNCGGETLTPEPGGSA